VACPRCPLLALPALWTAVAASPAAGVMWWPARTAHCGLLKLQALLALRCAIPTLPIPLTGCSY
jgi:hypothetical protein